MWTDCVGLFLRCHPSLVRRSLAYRLVYRRLFPALASPDDAVTWRRREQPMRALRQPCVLRIYIRSDTDRDRTHLTTGADRSEENLTGLCTQQKLRKRKEKKKHFYLLTLS